MDETCSTHGEVRNAYKSVLGGKGSLYRVKVRVKEVEMWGCGLDSSGSAQVPVDRPCEHGNESGRCKTRRIHESCARALLACADLNLLHRPDCRRPPQHRAGRFPEAVAVCTRLLGAR
jgi:hypothetical protein